MVLRLTHAADYAITDLAWLSLDELVASLADPHADEECAPVGSDDAAFTL